MSTGKRIVLSTFGSFGDIHPYIAIALELKVRGHSPVIATSEVYREKMAALGIELHPVRPNIPSYDEPDELSRVVAELMDAKGGTEKVIELLTPNLRDIYEDLDAAAEHADLLLTHPLPLVGPIVAQKRQLPWVSSVLSPISFFSAHDPPVLAQMPALYYLQRRSVYLSRLLYHIASFRLEKLMQPDWPPNTHVTGFAIYDRRDFFGETEMQSALKKFLDEGPPPIVFTLGSSAFWVAKDFYRDSIQAAQAL